MPDEFRTYLKKFTEDRHGWIAKVGARIFKGKGITVDEYCTALLEDNFIIDQVGIFIFAQMYHIHICIALGDRFLTTNRDNDLQNVPSSLDTLAKCGFAIPDPLSLTSRH